jgi:SAM-dependent methyltransferase
MYETKRAVDEYLQFHLGDPKDVLPYGEGAPHQALRFTQRCADLCSKHCRSAPAARRTVGGGGSSDDLLLMPFESGAAHRVRQGVALDVGCAVGGASFELTRHFRDVVGVDLSAPFVAAAKVLKERGRLTYKSLAEGTTYVTKEAIVNPRIDRTRVDFREGDACALPPSLLGGGGDPADAQHFQNFGRHDAVLAANLLCRLPDPEAFLRDCAKLVRPDGVLVLVSPYSWLEAWTPKHKWLGGARSAPGGDDEKKKTNRSFAAIRALLESPAGGFDLVDQTDLPFLIKEHDRKFQWGCSHATVWRRRRQSTQAR